MAGNLDHIARGLARQLDDIVAIRILGGLLARPPLTRTP